MSDRLVGRVLSFISNMVQPNHILEIGTFTGYGALCLAEGLNEDGFLITIESNPEYQYLINNAILNSPFTSKIKSIIGDAISIIPTLETMFDLVFIDASKTQYLSYLTLILPKMNPRGVILVDNTLWKGRVASETAIRDKEANAIDEFNNHVASNKEIQVVMIPLTDGLTLIRV